MDSEEEIVINTKTQLKTHNAQNQKFNDYQFIGKSNLIDSEEEPNQKQSKSDIRKQLC